MLQEDKGCLFDIINEIERLKNTQRKTLKERNEEIQKELDSKIEYDSLEYKTLINNLNDSIRMEIESLKFIRHKIQGFEKEVLIRKTKEYILFKDLEKDEDKFNKICDLLIEININKKFLNLDKELLLIVSSSEKNDVLNDNSKTITNKNYLSLIRVLIEQGYLDKNYWHYKGYFYKGSLGVNDIIFIKNINESKEQDHLLDVETPSEIINRLEKEDFYKFNILNKRILEYCINEDKIGHVVAISSSVFYNKDYKKLAEILESYDYDTIERYIFTLLIYNSANIEELLEVSKDSYFNAYNNILIAIYTNEQIDTKTIEKFNLYLENNWKVVSFLPEDRKDIFYSNISNVSVKFIDLQGDEINTDIIKKIESLNAYKLCVKNIVYITEKILDKSIQYGNLLSEIYNSSLSECKKNIDNNFVLFLEEYINKNENKEKFINGENILIKILNSGITDGDKIKYLNLNNTELTNISDFSNAFNNEDILNYMFERNLIVFNKDNINYICKNFNEISLTLKEGFIKYLKNYNVFHNLQNENLNDYVMTFILNFEGLENYLKIDLICKKIDNDTDVLLLRKYIETVEEISKLAEVWDNKIRKLETYEEQKVGNKLLEKGIVKRYGEGYPIKIFISKDKKR